MPRSSPRDVPLLSEGLTSRATLPSSLGPSPFAAQYAETDPDEYFRRIGNMKRRNRWLSNAALLSAGVAAIVLLSSLPSHTAAANALRWTAEAPERGARGWTCIAFGRLSGWTSYTGAGERPRMLHAAPPWPTADSGHSPASRADAWSIDRPSRFSAPQSMRCDGYLDRHVTSIGQPGDVKCCGRSPARDWPNIGAWRFQRHTEASPIRKGVRAGLVTGFEPYWNLEIDVG